MRVFYAFIVAILVGALDLTTAFTTLTVTTREKRLLNLRVSSPDTTLQEIDFEAPEDAVINIKPKAMQRLRELREKEKSDSLVLRMGVRNGGCSGLSYVMDFSTEDEIQEDDVVDEYAKEKLKCVVDAKSMLYLYGLELDYSDELIGGGFKFFNPNAEESCGCGSSFGV
jgi:iron-sulfur cluster assembly 1